MKVGIITFHWAPNYGAILQAYALQTALVDMGSEVEMIDYVPWNNSLSFFKCIASRSIKSARNKWVNLKRKKSIDKELMPLLNLSRHYSSESQLVNNPPDYDVYVTGSDQVWNESFTINGEGKATLSYFLSFVGQERKKIAYATSIGKNSLCATYWELVMPYLKKYNAISVREEDASELLRNKGIQSEVVPDPTLLIDLSYYDALFSAEQEVIAIYILHENQTEYERVLEKVKEKYPNYRIVNIGTTGIKRWGGFIKSAKMVITNSYHGLIFSVLYHRKAIVMPVEGSINGMNSRIETILNRLGIKEKVLYNGKNLERVIEDEINWDEVDCRVKSYVKSGLDYLRKEVFGKGAL